MRTLGWREYGGDVKRGFVISSAAQRTTWSSAKVGGSQTASARFPLLLTGKWNCRSVSVVAFMHSLIIKWAGMCRGVTIPSMGIDYMMCSCCGL